MTEELLKKLHTAMCNDNEHQCNRLNNYIHTDEYLTAEVVKVVREIVTEATKELQEEIKGQKEYIKYLKRQRQGGIQKQYNKVEKIKELEKQIEKMKQDAEQETCELLGIIQGKDKAIAELQERERWTILKTEDDLPAPRNDRQVLTWFKKCCGRPAEATILDADRFDVGGGVFAWKEIIPPEEYK